MLARRTFLLLVGGVPAARAAGGWMGSELAYEMMRAEARMPEHELRWLREAEQAALATNRHVLIVHVPDVEAADVDNDGVVDGSGGSAYTNRARVWGAAFASEAPRLAVMLGSLEVVCSTFRAARRVFAQVRNDRSWGWIVGPSGRTTPFGARLQSRNCGDDAPGFQAVDGRQTGAHRDCASKAHGEAGLCGAGARTQARASVQEEAFAEDVRRATALIAAMEDAARGQLPVLEDLTGEQVIQLAVPSTADVFVRGGRIYVDGGLDGHFLDFLHPVRIERAKNDPRGSR